MADVVVGAKLELDAGAANTNVKSFKQELRLAQNEVLAITEKFGATSKEAANAAKKAADLADKIGDAKRLTDTFNPDQKFRAFSQSLTGVLGGFTAVQGAMGLLGVESADVQKQLLKVQSALALSQGLNQLGELKDAFGNILTLLKNNIPVAIAGIGLIILKIFEWKKEVTALDEVNQSAIKNSIEERTKLDLLVQSVQNTTISTKDRLAKVKDLQKEFPGYFDNIKTEKDLNDKLTTAYQNATASILAKAKATAAFNKIVEGENKILEIQKKTQDYVDQFKGWKGYEADIARVVKANDAAISEIRKQNEELAKAAQQAPPPPPKVLTDPEKKAIHDAEVQKELFRLETQDIAKQEAAAKMAQQAAATLTDNKIHNAGDIFGGLTAEDHTLVTSSQLRTEFENEESRKRIIDAEIEKNAKLSFYSQIGAGLSELSALVGQQTAAGKIIALATIAAGTAVAFIQGLDIAQKSAKGTGPAAAFAFPIFYATQIAAILGAAARAKAILSGGSGGGSSISGGTTTAPLTPSPAVTNTLLNQQQLNQIGNASIRAYVTEVDITNNQERVRRLNRASRIG